MIIRFLFDMSHEKNKKQEKWTEENYEKIKNIITGAYLDWAAIVTRPDSTKGKAKSIIEKHLDAYVKKNTFDYFIHKDLRGFLNRELDFYIKNEIIRVDDIDADNESRIFTCLSQIKAVKQIGRTIIDFLAQIENFQKKLWLKKKFVVRCGWCITLDRIPETFYEEIRRNKAQIQERIGLYAIDEFVNAAELVITPQWENPPDIEFLKANKYLIVDTKHFNGDFKDRLISSIEDIDEATDGLLIHSENFQALNLLQERYKEKIDCVYIDPRIIPMQAKYYIKTIMNIQHGCV